MPNLNVFSLEGKTALVAGASRGIGLAIAQHIARAGARTILASRSVEKLQANAKALCDEGCAAEARECDIADQASINRLVEALPPVDILINVSGTNVRKRFADYTPEEYERIMNTNLHGIVYLTQRVGGAMVERGTGGKIIMIGSLTSALGLPYLAVYTMTKSALAGLTRTLAAEWGRHGIQVNCIAPGFIVTDMNREMWQRPEMKQWAAGVQAAPRTGTPDDIAPLAVYLSGKGSDFVTGQLIFVDGGYSTTAVWPFEP
jgi:NAD(P)-dependent dehydrogenase (short-subunit alcohol dehydrogenase family)